MIMDAPKITVNGKEFTARRPTAGQWREFAELASAKDSLAIDEWMLLHAELIRKMFGRLEITTDYLLRPDRMDELMKLFEQCFDWILQIIKDKMDQIPDRKGKGHLQLKLNPEETVLAIYMHFYEDFGWTRDQVDALPLDYLLSVFVVNDKIEHAKVLMNIEDVLM